MYNLTSFRYQYLNRNGSCPPAIHQKNANNQLYNTIHSYDNHTRRRSIYVTHCRNCNTNIRVDFTKKNNSPCVSTTLLNNFR